jgi:hypothetical protein
LRYYDTGSVYDSAEARSFTKRLIFSGWALVPKVVSALVTFESERRAYTERRHNYTSEYGRRGGQRLSFRTEERKGTEQRPGESQATKRVAAMTAFVLVWPSVTLAELGDPRAIAGGGRPQVADVLAVVQKRIAEALAPVTSSAPTDGPVDQRWYWAAPLFLDQRHHPAATELLLGRNAANNWDDFRDGFLAHLDEARAMLDFGPHALGRPPENLARLIAALAIGGPAQCALRAIAAVSGLPLDHETTLFCGARVASAFRSYFNAPEVTGIVRGQRTGSFESEGAGGRYWRDVIQHAIFGNLQAVLDEHAHILRDWRGYLELSDPNRRIEAARDIAGVMAEALATRTSSFRVDVPRPGSSGSTIELDTHRMRTRFAVAFGNQSLDEGGEQRQESVSVAFNSPFWPFVLVTTSIGQEGLDFHLWCHAVVHWNLPANPVDLEQREGRVHRYKCHAVRRNVAATLEPAVLVDGFPIDCDPWDQLFSRAASIDGSDDEISPWWVFGRGPAKIERLVPVMPFSREAVRLPQLRKMLAAYRLAFGQPRQEELIEFLGADRDDAKLLDLASRLRIDLSPPAIADEVDEGGQPEHADRSAGPKRTRLQVKPATRERRAEMATTTRDRQRRWTTKSTGDVMVAPRGSGYHWMLTDDEGEVVGVQTWFGDGRWAYGPVKIAKASPGKVAELLREAVDNPVPPLMGAAEAAAALGVNQTNLRALSGLPKPVQVLAMGSVWRAQDIIDYKAWREANPPKPGPKSRRN